MSFLILRLTGKRGECGICAARHPGLHHKDASSALAPTLPDRRFERKAIRMIRFFDIADRARLPWRFARADRGVLARLR